MPPPHPITSGMADQSAAHLLAMTSMVMAEAVATVAMAAVMYPWFLLNQADASSTAPLWSPLPDAFLTDFPALIEMLSWVHRVAPGDTLEVLACPALSWPFPRLRYVSSAGDRSQTYSEPSLSSYTSSLWPAVRLIDWLLFRPATGLGCSGL